MKHPLFKNPALLIWYIAFWIILSVIQFLLETRIFGANLSITLVDVIISNVIFALLGLGVWYVVIGGVNEKRTQLYLVFYHLFAMLFIVSFWMWLTSQIDMTLFESDSVKSHMKLVMPGKAGLGALIYILIAVFYYTFFFYNRLDEKSNVEARFKQLVTQTQLNELKSQINPHFLFNSLNSVSYLTIAEPEKAQEMVIKLSSFLRYSLKHKQNEMVTIEQEIEHIKLYLEIEKVRFGDKLQTDFKVESCINCQIPNMILQPIYENAIKYGVYETTSQVEIKTTAYLAKDEMIFKVSNNFDPEAVVKKGEGIGLFNIRRRLGLVYGNTTLLSFTNENQIFTVTLVIPQNKKLS
ncbi:MAG: histidine kinase [Prolixibacteraceae bacterium]|jgi:two-component system LytT family sensor kinase|nr:histidine kinase [Prolixibacteraceae bacterium]